jgi:hypothetical protein
MTRNLAISAINGIAVRILVPITAIAAALAAEQREN